MFNDKFLPITLVVHIDKSVRYVCLSDRPSNNFWNQAYSEYKHSMAFRVRRYVVIGS